ncbi:dual-specificity RNA methyltransferase RlmN [Spirochaeta dissipatitropha]
MTDILNISRTELSELIESELAYPAYRSRQVLQWIWKHGVRNFADMKNVPLQLRTELAERFCFNGLSCESTAISSDGTRKMIFKLHDDHVIEGVLIPASDGRLTACISSQVGCTLRCAFCATARIPYRRNLSIGEICDQFSFLQNEAKALYGKGLNNLVYMGMGEPLANLDAVCESIRIITGEMGLAPRRITLSTAGMVPEIRKLADENLGIQFAVSLHSAIDESRRSLMSAGRDHSLEELGEAIRYWHARTGNKVTLEYLILAGTNDSADHLRALIRYASALPCKINVIEYNPIVGIPFSAGKRNELDNFAARLADAGLLVTVRHSGGKDIDAACGQLAARSLPKAE